MMYCPFRHAGSVFSRRRPVHLTFFITRRCNAQCPFCFYLKAGTPENTDSELTTDEIRKISPALGSLLWLAFSGGEIFLRQDLPEISSIFYKNNRPAIMLFPSNGLLPGRIRDMTEQILRDSPKSVIAVKLSLDGLHEEHDKMRNTPGSFSKTLETYNLLKGLSGSYPNFELGINTVFCSENQDKMDGIIDFVNKLDNIRTHSISLIRGNLIDKSFTQVDPLKYDHAAKRLAEGLKGKESSHTYRFRGARIKAAQDILQRKFILKTLNEQKRLVPCYAGRLNIVLSEDGEIYPCEILTESFGNVRDNGYSIPGLLKSDRAKAIMQTIENRLCYCTHECYFMTNILFNPRLYPALAREYIRIR